MRVIIAVHHFPPHYIAGAEWRAYRTASTLQARGHDIQVVCVEKVHLPSQKGHRGNSGVRLVWEDDIYQGVKVRRLSFELNAVPDPVLFEYDNAWIGSHLQELFELQKPDIFHLIGGYLISGRSLQVAQSMGIPTIVTLTDYWFLCKRINMLQSNEQVCELPINPAKCARCLGEEKRRYRWPGRMVSRLMDGYWSRQKVQIQQAENRYKFLHETLNQAGKIICPSEFLRQVYSAEEIDPNRLCFSRQGRDFGGIPLKKSPRSITSPLRIGYIGQLAKIKGVHVLLDAVRRMPGARLEVKIYGNPNSFPGYLASLQKLAGSDPRVVFKGSFQASELSRVLRDIDVIVVPSLWNENCPNVILEAFGHRTPVIASRLGGMAELVEDGHTGLLFTPGNAKELAAQIRRLLDDPALLISLAGSIRSVKTIDEEMAELEQIYRQQMDTQTDSAVRRFVE